MKALLRVGVVCLSLMVAPAFAQGVDDHATAPAHTGGTSAGASSGAAAGAAVAGPVGALIGAVAGAAAGHGAGPPTEVRTYVVAQTLTPTAYRDAIMVGRPIAAGVVWLQVPGYPKYRWACLNGQRVVVDSDTHTVVAVY